MTLLKLTVLVSCLCMVFSGAFGLICVNTSTNYQLFGSALSSDTLSHSFKMAFVGQSFDKYKIYSADTEIKFVHLMQYMASKHCSVILGLFSSKDCLMAGPILKKNKIIGISSSCADDGIAKFKPYLYTATPPLSKYMDKIAEYLNQLKAEKIFIIYQPVNIYDMAEFDSLKKALKKKYTEIPVSSELSFDINKFSQQTKEKRILVFLTYPLPSAQLLVNMANHGLITKQVDIISSPSWVFDMNSLRFVASILKKANTVTVPDVLREKKLKTTKFYREFKGLFHRNPLIVEALTYQVTSWVTSCYKQAMVGGNYSVSKFRQCLTSSNKLYLSKGSVFSHRPIYLTNFLRILKDEY